MKSFVSLCAALCAVMAQASHAQAPASQSPGVAQPAPPGFAPLNTRPDPAVPGTPPA